MPGVFLASVTMAPRERRNVSWVTASIDRKHTLFSNTHTCTHTCTHTHTIVRSFSRNLKEMTTQTLFLSTMYMYI